jgi:hypothetical protein
MTQNEFLRNRTNPWTPTAYEMPDLLATELQEIGETIADIEKWKEMPDDLEELKRYHLKQVQCGAKGRKRLIKKRTKLVERWYVLNVTCISPAHGQGR